MDVFFYKVLGSNKAVGLMWIRTYLVPVVAVFHWLELTFDMQNSGKLWESIGHGNKVENDHDTLRKL